MNSEKVLYNKIYESPRPPQRMVLKPNWLEGRKDTTKADEREPDVTSTKHGETRRGANEDDDTLPKIDYRIQGLPLSTVEQEDHTRKEAVKKLIHPFETHPNREALKADLRHNYTYNPVSEKSQDMISSMGNVEYFEMCEKKT